MPQNESGERRQHPRRAFSGSVRISTIDPEIDVTTGRSFFRTAHEACLDVSRGGVRLVSNEPFLTGHRLLLELALPDGETVDAVGRVAWSRIEAGPDQRRSVGLGIEFVGGDGRGMARLEALLHRAGEASGMPS